MSNVAARNTGNDILAFNGNTYRVSVWEPTGTTQAFGWSVDFGGVNYTGTLPLGFTSGIGDPDVCLVVKQGDDYIFAVVAYYHQGTSSWYTESLLWDDPSASFIPFTGPDVLATGGFGNSINIDGNEWPGGQFAIVWDDADGKIYSTTGDMSNWITFNALNIAVGSWPDVSLFYGGSSNIAHVTYIDANGDLVVDDHTYANLQSGISSPSIVLFQNPSNSGAFISPRIASPPGVNGLDYQWHVVVYEQDIISPKNYIIGYNNNSNSSPHTPIIYTSGSWYPVFPFSAPLEDAGNYHPSVCYDSNFPVNGAGIWVGWNFADPLSVIPSNPFPFTEYSIVQKCDMDGLPLSQSNYYWIVPNNLTSGVYDLAGFLSLAGRWGNDELFLTYVVYQAGGTVIEDVAYKQITAVSGAGSFKSSSLENYDLSPSASSICMNDKDPIVVSCYASDGALLLQRNVTCADLTEMLKHPPTNAMQGITLWRLYNSVSGHTRSFKQHYQY